MVEKLAKYYGEEICEIDGEKYHAFPKVHLLAQESVEDKLRTNGFGYRAKYISKTAQHIVDSGGEEWIDQLKLMSYGDAKKELMSLMGIGAKVTLSMVCCFTLIHSILLFPGSRLHLFNVVKPFTSNSRRHPHLSNSQKIIYAEITR